MNEEPDVPFHCLACGVLVPGWSEQVALNRGTCSSTCLATLLAATGQPSHFKDLSHPRSVPQPRPQPQPQPRPQPQPQPQPRPQPQPQPQPHVPGEHGQDQQGAGRRPAPQRPRPGRSATDAFFDEYPELRGNIGSPEYVAFVDGARQMMPAGWGAVLDNLRSKIAILGDPEVTELNRLRQELLESTAWHRSDGALAVAVTAGAINAFCNLILDLLPDAKVAWSLAPARAALEEALIKGEFSVEQFLNTLAQGAAFADWTASSPVRALIVALTEFTKRLVDTVSSAVEHAALRKEVARQLEQIEQALRRREAQLELELKDPTRHGPPPAPAEIEALRRMYEAQNAMFRDRGITPILPFGATDPRLAARGDLELLYWAVMKMLHRYVYAHREYAAIRR